jgi:hypothetical protein
MSSTVTAMGSLYDQKRAGSELQSYQKKGPIPSTRALIEAILRRESKVAPTAGAAGTRTGSRICTATSSIWPTLLHLQRS